MKNKSLSDRRREYNNKGAKDNECYKHSAVGHKECQFGEQIYKDTLLLDQKTYYNILDYKRY